MAAFHDLPFCFTVLSLNSQRPYPVHPAAACPAVWSPSNLIETSTAQPARTVFLIGPAARAPASANKPPGFGFPWEICCRGLNTCLSPIPPHHDGRYAVRLLLQPSETASMMSVVLLFLAAVLMGPVGMVTQALTKMRCAWLCEWSAPPQLWMSGLMHVREFGD